MPAGSHISRTTRPTRSDDAYISFRYSRNLARALEPVYNPGDYVKGYSNTLFTCLMAIPELFDSDPIHFSKLLGFASFVALSISSCRVYWREPPTAVSDRALWLLALLATSSALAVHSVNGLETGLHTLLVFAAVTRRVREQQDKDAEPWSALWCSALVLSRPEGILIYAAIASHDLLFRVLKRRFGRADLIFYLVPPLVYATELAWSQWYYGAALPQTYYAKTDLARTLYCKRCSTFGAG